MILEDVFSSEIGNIVFLGANWSFVVLLQ